MFRGSLVAIVTPMTHAGAVDYSAFEDLIDWHIEQGTDGLVVLGTTGESATIDACERKRIIEVSVAKVKGKLPVIVGTGSNSTQVAEQFTREAMELGADAALLVTPYYNKPTQEGLYQHYATIARAVPLPQILYNVPSRTACDLLTETVKRLSGIPNIVALKDATGDMRRLAETREHDCSIDLLSGDDGTAMQFMLNGGDGAISVVANVAPSLYKTMCDAALKGDKETASTCNEKMSALHAALFVESNPIPTKWLLSNMQLVADGIRLPLTPLSQSCYEQVEKAAQQAGINFKIMREL